MESFFFGNSERQLYGVFHAASPEKYRGRAVLLLFPLGQEYMRIHRAFRRLADLLAEQGFDVMRFDYACTGDSSGSFRDITYDALNDSAEIAYDELKAMSPDAQVDVVALRLGTVVARQLAQNRKVRRLVLWEPYYSDGEFLQQWEVTMVENGMTRANFIDDNFLHFNGFAYGSTIRMSMLLGNWSEFSAAAVSDLLVLSTRDSSDFNEFKFAFGGATNLEIRSVDGPDDWAVVDSVGGLFLPEPSIVAIREWLAA